MDPYNNYFYSQYTYSNTFAQQAQTNNINSVNPPPPGISAPGIPPPPGISAPGIPPPPGISPPGIPPPPGLSAPGISPPGTSTGTLGISNYSIPRPPGISTTPTQNQTYSTLSSYTYPYYQQNYSINLYQPQATQTSTTFPSATIPKPPSTVVKPAYINNNSTVSKEQPNNNSYNKVKLELTENKTFSKY
ncbi:hypothetical protein BCR36DRAFT_67151 [Piromyces finnis]|uniref:Uncharacterized protein n=1 Tax=Piromyces finnis TaxID=1754191 RepID=A0A1Y1V7Q9_9FUNG|nr:hypothetical protein BCR36DRAFT_67151 [Piromyces finnis]|eukprot:ORX49269.1 hypothetical protein BCR36DRAFT_67151 [Piromyces finnis]